MYYEQRRQAERNWQPLRLLLDRLIVKMRAIEQYEIAQGGMYYMRLNGNPYYRRLHRLLRRLLDAGA